VLCTQSNELLSVWLTDGELDDEGNPWTTDTIFSKRIANEFIDTRSLILGGLIDGLSLRGKRDTSLEELHKGSELSGLLSHVPIAACSKILFARPNLSYDDVYTSLYVGEFHWFSTKLFSRQLSMHTRSFHFQFIMPPHHTNQRIGRRQMERPNRIWTATSSNKKGFTKLSSYHTSEKKLNRIVIFSLSLLNAALVLHVYRMLLLVPAHSRLRWSSIF
jgi:hypothetical protein